MENHNLLLNDILQSLTHPFYVIDANTYEVLLANKAARNGVKSELNTCFSITHKRDTPCVGVDPCPLEIVKKTKKPTVLEHIHYDKEGNPRYVEVYGYPILDENSNVTRMIEYSLDITEKKQSKLEMQKALEIQRNFVSIVSHELRTPLASIKSSLDILHSEEPGKLTEDQKVFMNRVNTNIDRLSNLINDILDLSKIESGKIAMNFLPHDVELIV